MACCGSGGDKPAFRKEQSEDALELAEQQDSVSLWVWLARGRGCSRGPQLGGGHNWAGPHNVHYCCTWAVSLTLTPAGPLTFDL